MMEDMTHVQMSLAYTLRHLTSVLRVLSAMLSKYMREIKILGMDVNDGHLLVFLHYGQNRWKKSHFGQIFKLVYVIFSLLSQKDYWKKISLSMSPLSVRKHAQNAIISMDAKNSFTLYLWVCMIYTYLTFCSAHNCWEKEGINSISTVL